MDIAYRDKVVGLFCVRFRAPFNDEVLKKSGLNKERMASPTDSIARKNNYISSDADWLSLKRQLHTSGIKQQLRQVIYKSNGRTVGNYFITKWIKMLNFYAYNSAQYEVKRDKWKNVNIEVYYHKGT
jgi:ABC-2 type transport system permease protein